MRTIATAITAAVYGAYKHNSNSRWPPRTRRILQTLAYPPPLRPFVHLLNCLSGQLTPDIATPPSSPSNPGKSQCPVGHCSSRLPIPRRHL